MMTLPNQQMTPAPPSANWELKYKHLRHSTDLKKLDSSGWPPTPPPKRSMLFVWWLPSIFHKNFNTFLYLPRNRGRT